MVIYLKQSTILRKAIKMSYHFICMACNVSVMWRSMMCGFKYESSFYHPLETQ